MKHKKKRICFTMASIILIAVSAMQCTVQAKGKTEITLMHFWGEEQAEKSGDTDSWRAMLKEWKAEHPDVWLDESIMSQMDYTNKIQALAALVDLPDIMLVKGSWMENFVNSGLLMEMDSYIETYEYKDSFYEDVFLGSTKNGYIYGIPCQASLTSFVFYNEALWKEAGYEIFPDNWEDIYKAAEYFAEKGIATFALGNGDQWASESCWLSALGDRYTGSEWTNSIIAADGEAKFTDEEFVNALEHMEDLVPLFNKDFRTISDAKAVEAYYSQGKAAAVVTGHWAVGYINSSASEEIVKNTQIALLPAVDGGKGEENTTAGGYGWFFAINSDVIGTEKEALCMDLLLKTCGYEASEYYVEHYGMKGSSRIENPDLSGIDELSAKLAAVIAEIERFTPTYDLFMDASVISVMNEGLQELLGGEKNANELAQEIQEVQEIYSNR